MKVSAFMIYVQDKRPFGNQWFHTIVPMPSRAMDSGESRFSYLLDQYGDIAREIKALLDESFGDEVGHFDFRYEFVSISHQLIEQLANK